MTRLWTFDTENAFIPDYVGPMTLNEAAIAFDRVWMVTTLKNKRNSNGKNAYIYLYAYPKRGSRDELQHCYRSLDLNKLYTDWAFPSNYDEKVFICAEFAFDTETFPVSVKLNSFDDCDDILDLYGIVDGPMYEYPYLPLQQAVETGKPFLHYTVPYVQSISSFPTPDAHSGVYISDQLYPQGGYVNVPKGAEITTKSIVFDTITKAPTAVWKEASCHSYASDALECYLIDAVCDSLGNITFKYRNHIKCSALIAWRESRRSPFLPTFCTLQTTISYNAFFVISKVKYLNTEAFLQPLDVRVVDIDENKAAFIKFIVRNATDTHEAIRMNMPNVLKRKVEDTTQVKRRRVAEELLLLY